MGGRRMLARVLGRYRMFLDAADVGFATHMLLDGLWEYEITKFVAATIKPGMVVVDVGANFGYYTLLMSDFAGPSGRCISLEPNPEIVECLRDTVAVNGLTKRCVIHQLAASHHNSEGILVVPKGEPKNGTLFRDPTEAGASTHTIALRTLDEVLADEPRIDFIKIDAEGSEGDILEGMQQTLRKHRPRLLMEFNMSHAYDGPAMLENLLAIYGSLNFVDGTGRARSITGEKACIEARHEDLMLYFSP